MGCKCASRARIMRPRVRGGARRRAAAREAAGPALCVSRLAPSPAVVQVQLMARRSTTEANAKGRLWELCAQRRISVPEVRHSAVGPRHRAQMLLVLEEWELDSGVHWGSSRQLAEQLAARALLVELDALERDEPSVRPPRSSSEPDLGDDVFDVEEGDGARLRQSNPKGQVYEWCQKQKPQVRRPRFEVRQVRGGGVMVRGILDTLELRTPWFRARRRKPAEHAAAEALLLLLPGPEDGADVDVTKTAHPRTLLNEMFMHGQLTSCDVDVIAAPGASPPRFEARGRATLPDGAVVEAQPAEGSTKRKALALAAAALLAELDRAGVTPSG